MTPDNLRRLVRQKMASMIAKGNLTAREADEAAEVIATLSQRELIGELTEEQTAEQIIAFTHTQLRRRAN